MHLSRLASVGGLSWHEWKALEVIIGRIKPGTSHFKMDTNYLKVAVSIAIQTWLHDSPKLE